MVKQLNFSNFRTYLPLPRKDTQLEGSGLTGKNNALSSLSKKIFENNKNKNS